MRAPRDKGTVSKRKPPGADNLELRHSGGRIQRGIDGGGVGRHPEAVVHVPVDMDLRHRRTGGFLFQQCQCQQSNVKSAEELPTGCSDPLSPTHTHTLPRRVGRGGWVWQGVASSPGVAIERAHVSEARCVRSPCRPRPPGSPRVPTAAAAGSAVGRSPPGSPGSQGSARCGSPRGWGGSSVRGHPKTTAENSDNAASTCATSATAGSGGPWVHVCRAVSRRKDFKYR